MNHRYLWIAFSVSALCLFLLAQQGSAALFAPLGDLPGGEYLSTPSDVSADGSVVVGASAVRESTSIEGWGDPFDAFRWTSDRGMMALGLPYVYSKISVSADGAVVVGCCDSKGSFKWTESGGMVAHFDGVANDVSADGAVVVGQVGREAVRWKAGGGMAGLGFLPNANSFSEALGVSADGAVVVGSSHSFSGEEEAFRWTSDGGMVGLGGLPGGEGFFSSRANAVSDDGSVIVGSSPVVTTSLTSLAQAFRWTIEGGMVGLGELPGGSQSSRASGVSADGSVVVGYANYGEGPPEAFVWEETHGMRSVESVLADLGADTTGWSLWVATAISADGTTIVGYGTNPAGQIEAWLANITVTNVPEPTGAVTLLGILGIAAACRVRIRKTPLLVVGCLGCLLPPLATFAAPSYRIVPLGLDGPEHTRLDGYRASYAHLFFTTINSLNEAGQVIGQSFRYNGGNDYLGRSAWFYNGDTTINIGLTGAEFTRSDGAKFSWAEKQNEAGKVIGYSERFDAPTEGSVARDGFLHARSAWLYDGTTTIDIGLVDDEHTRDDGYKYSNASQLNEAGHVIGHSMYFNGGSDRLGSSPWLYDGIRTVKLGLVGPEFSRSDGYQFSWAGNLSAEGHVSGGSYRYRDDTDFGHSAWYYDGAATVDIGLAGPEHTRSDGYKFSEPQNYFADESTDIAGVSGRYNGGSLGLGVSAWIYDGTTTTVVGLTDCEHTRDDGFRNSYFFKSLDYQVADVNNAGQTAGVSQRFNGGSNSLGWSAWFYDGAKTIPIGLVGPEHTKSDSYQENHSLHLNEAGYVIGTSAQFNGGSEQSGGSVWLYNGATTIEIGLTGPEHTRSDGIRFSGVNTNLPKPLNDAGHVVGNSARYNGSESLGSSAWLYNGTTTIEIGLTGPEYTRDDGHRVSAPSHLNDVGQVVGISQRYDSNTQDAWIYDPVLDQTIALRFPGIEVVSSDVAYLGDDGLVLGKYYQKVGDTFLGGRPFYFTIADGLHDLGSLVDDGLAGDGWGQLAKAIGANRAGHILGQGSTLDGSQMAYLLTPTLPEPNSGVLTALATLTLFQCRRRRSCLSGI